MVWNELYINPSASGGDGSEGSPWTLAEWWVAVEAGAGTVPNGSRGNVKDDGTYTQADLIITRDGLDGAPVMTEGYTAVPGDGGVATIERQAGEVNTWFNLVGAQYMYMKSLKLDALNIGDGAGYLIYALPTSKTINCELTGGLFNIGFFNSNLINCKVHGITTGNLVYNSRLFHSLIIGDSNTEDGGYTTRSCSHFYTIVKAEGPGANWKACIAPLFSTNSIFDTSQGTQSLLQGVSSADPLVNCIFMNCSPSQVAVINEGTLINPVFFNNPGGNYDDTKVLVYNPTVADPQFVDTARYDYRIRNRSLYGLGLSEVGLQRTNYQITPGVDQVAIIIPYSGDVIETENAYGYSGDPIGGTYIRASGDQVIDSVTWGDKGTEFTGLWEAPAVTIVKEDEEYGPTTKLTGTYVGNSMPLSISIDGVSGMNARNFTQNEAAQFVITVTDKDDAAINVSAAGTTITMWGKHVLDGTSSGYLFQKTTADFTKTVGGAANVISVNMSEADLNWYGTGYLILQFGISSSSKPKAWLRLKGSRSPE